MMTDEFFDSSESMQVQIEDGENFKLAAHALRDHNVMTKQLFIMRVTELLSTLDLPNNATRKLHIQAQPTICTSDQVEMKLSQIYTNSCITIPICYRCDFLVKVAEVKLMNGTCDRVKIYKKKGKSKKISSSIMTTRSQQ
ncbi:hypothetical protein D918_07817 [Trichuris suis]|nr:hypothetical protein D918_07817 [Trichuris suis]